MRYPIPDPMPPMRCPWWPTCEAMLAPVPHLDRPGSPEFVWVYPIHDVEGPGAWFGRCPTSQFQINFTAGGSFFLSDYAREYLARAGEFYTRQLVKRMIKRARDNPQPQAGEPTMADVVAWMAHDDGGPVAGAALRNLRRPERPIEESFPGRPADAPEPGAGEPAAGPVPKGVGGGHFTGRENVSDREQLKGLALVAAGQLNQLQGVLQRMKDAADELGTLAVAAEHQIRSASVLVTQAVGSGKGAPLPGEQMAEYTALAKSTISGSGGDMAKLVALLTTRIESAQTQVSNAESNARQYAAIP